MYSIYTACSTHIFWGGAINSAARAVALDARLRATEKSTLNAFDSWQKYGRYKGMLSAGTIVLFAIELRYTCIRLVYYA